MKVSPGNQLLFFLCCIIIAKDGWRINMYENRDHKKVTKEGADIKILNGSPCKIRRGEDRRLWVSTGDRDVPVTIHYCFPWSDPSRYISLRDDDGDEVVLLSDLNGVDDESRHVLQSALKQAGFVLEIIRILSIHEDFEIRNWHVITRQGSRRFQTQLDEWPYEVPGGGLIIQDLAGDLYYVEDPGKMDKTSKKLFWTVSG